ncbi:DUF551 domain-containing protein [Acetobacteraceae bacterium]|nr:DUF551 domain-containing protein [Acetobacteraceae bacterium]
MRKDPRIKALEIALMPCRCAGETEAESYRRALKEADLSAWRNAKITPAPENEEVLVFAVTNNPFLPTIISSGSFMAEYLEWNVSGYSEKELKVTHWQPLPPDPLEEKVSLSRSTKMAFSSAQRKGR